MDRVVVLLAGQLAEARDRLRAALAETRHDDPDFAMTLAAVRDLRVIPMRELAQWAGISRSTLYELLKQADER